MLDGTDRFGNSNLGDGPRIGGRGGVHSHWGALLFWGHFVAHVRWGGVSLAW
jgi:hypothetical protein